MPLLVPCQELEPGMRLCEPILARNRVMLAGGKVLTHADVDALQRRYPEVWVRVGDPILDDVVEFEDDSHDRKVAATVQGKIAKSMSEVSRRFSSRASIQSMNVSAIHESVAGIIDYLDDNPVSAALLHQSLDSGTPLAERAGNVFYLSMILGCAVRDYISRERRRSTACRWLDLKISMDLLPLGVGAMFCDIGLLPISHIFTQREPLSEEDCRALVAHPNTGADMLPTSFAAAARSIVRTHHENCDGTGYPSGLVGDKIHVFSRIVRIADAYNAATASNVYKEAKSPARALWEMTAGTYRAFYDPVLMKVFSRLIQPFPIGAKLHLCDGRQAAVVGYNHVDPLRPRVVIAFDVNGNRLPNSALEGPLDLSDRPDLRIASFAGEDLGFLYESTAADEAPAHRGPFNSLFEATFP